MFETSLRDSASKLRIAAKIALLVGVVAAIVVLVSTCVNVVTVHQDTATIENLGKNNPELKGVVLKGSEADRVVDALTELKQLTDSINTLNTSKVFDKRLADAMKIVDQMPRNVITQPTPSPTPTLPVVELPEGVTPEPTPTATPEVTHMPALIMLPSFQNVLDLDETAVKVATEKNLGSWTFTTILVGIAKTLGVLLAGWAIALYLSCWAVPMQSTGEKGFFGKLLGNCGEKLLFVARVIFVLGILAGVLVAIGGVVAFFTEDTGIIALLLKILGGVAVGIVGWVVALATQNWGENATYWAHAYSRNPIRSVKEIDAE